MFRLEIDFFLKWPPTGPLLDPQNLYLHAWMDFLKLCKIIKDKVVYVLEFFISTKSDYTNTNRQLLVITVNETNCIW
jgi:hypothetical protein